MKYKKEGSDKKDQFTPHNKEIFFNIIKTSSEREKTEKG
jgi:hypothetical protein